MPANILNLPRLVVTQVEETDHDYHIKAQASTDPTACPECRHTGLVGFGRNEQLIKDLPMHGKRVGIYFDTRAVDLRVCGAQNAAPSVRGRTMRQPAHQDSK